MHERSLIEHMMMEAWEACSGVAIADKGIGECFWRWGTGEDRSDKKARVTLSSHREWFPGRCVRGNECGFGWGGAGFPIEEDDDEEEAMADGPSKSNNWGGYYGRRVAYCTYPSCLVLALRGDAWEWLHMIDLIQTRQGICVRLGLEDSKPMNWTNFMKKHMHVLSSEDSILSCHRIDCSWAV